MRNSNKLVCGIGVKGNLYQTTENGKKIPVYSLWINMLLRSTKEHWVKYPSYTNTTCSENFKSYTFFYEWCQTQIGFNLQECAGDVWQLDKDILIDGNKHYSEDTCVFVPRRVNLLLIKRNSKRGSLPIGVSFNKSSKFIAQCSGGCVAKTVYLGSFNTPQEAFQAYKIYKESLIKQVANEYKEQLDYRVYDVLMNYEVNEND